MPASITHMLVAGQVRDFLATDKTLKSDFLGLLQNNKECMALGSLGPDLPYYESMAKGALDILLSRSDKPMGVDQWSYQLHSKDPNAFPLKMIEITWKDTAMDKDDWEGDDYKKFAFVAGFLTHIAADQIIHPVVNLIAGPYYKTGSAREKHRDCEVHQDVYLYKKMHENKSLGGEPFYKWCDIAPESSTNAPVWLRYLLQKAFVEAHAVMPEEESIENWLDGILTVLRMMDHFGPYLSAEKALANQAGPKWDEYVALKTVEKVVGGRTYDAFLKEAVALACCYVKALHLVWTADEMDEALRRKFLSVVQNADLGAPLDLDILEHAQEALEK